MLSKKLLSLLQTFSKQDLSQFRKFIHSPYYNENQELIQLFQLINDEFNHNSSKLDDISLEKKLAWKKRFDEKVYQDTKMRRLSSDLNKLAERFLLVNSILSLLLSGLGFYLGFYFDLIKFYRKQLLQHHLENLIIIIILNL